MNALQPSRKAPADAGEIRLGLFEVLDIVWSSRLILAVLVVVCTAGAAIASFVVDQQFEAKILLSPVSDQSSRSGLGAAVGSAMSQLGGLSALTGLGLSANEAKAETIATLQSEALTERYIDANKLLPVLYPRKWDSERQRWKSDDPDSRPTLWKANQYFDKNVRTVETNGKTGLVTMTIRWKDPRLAAAWANDMVKLTNQYMRDRTIQETTRNIAYLEEQASKSTVVEIRNGIYQLMESEIKKQMLARGSDEYALKVIDPATIPERRSFPQRKLWTLAGFALGLVLGLGVAVARHSLRLERANRSASS
jgi:uncharacterized protein involved in exopolysaccharide biosynthesis